MHQLKSLSYFVFLLMLAFSFSSCESEGSVVSPYSRVIQFGDNSLWAAPDFDDRQWDQSGSTQRTGIFWVRFKIDFNQNIDAIKHKGIQAISWGSFEAYWDGHLIHRNGLVGNNVAAEIPGDFISHMIIPDSLSQYGTHTLALRVSNYHNPFDASWNTFFVEEYLSTSKNDLRLTAIMFLLGGAYLIAALYYLFLFFVQRKKYLNFIFGLMCFLFFGLIIMEYFKFFYNYPYPFHYWRLFSISLLTIATTFIVPVFLSILFNIPRRKYFIVAYALVIVLYLIISDLTADQTTQMMSLMMLITSALISIYALVLKRKGSTLVLVAISMSGLLSYFSTYGFNQLRFNYDINLFLGFTILVLSILYLMAQRTKAQNMAYESSLLLSARLKNELLKKNIQPHFLMNTLTSIMEWVEVSPKKSIEFIEALAGELEILNEIADLKQIPISQEIELCKKHLSIMGYRKEIKYLWNETDIDNTEQVPPAIFHTIIENGITHSIPNKEGEISFHLDFEKELNQKTYTLRTIAQNRNGKKKSGGTGLKYIESRLKESYGDRWRLSSHETSNGWETKIIITEK